MTGLGLRMEERLYDAGDGSAGNPSAEEAAGNSRGEDVAANSRGEDDFRSCCGDEEEWEDTEESFMAGVSEAELDETSVRLFFKGVSSSDADGKKLSGIGVVMERTPGVPLHRVQKKLDFYVDELVAEHLALMDGLLVALQKGIRKIFAFTNSEKLYFQIAEAEILEDQLLVALGHRILELVEKLEDFDLILLPSFELERPLKLAKEAIGIVYVSPYEVATCPLCCEERRGSHMIKVGCSHKFCYSCLIVYVEGRLHASKLPIRCPQLRCKYHISAGECKSFLPVSSYESLESAFAVGGSTYDMEGFYCPYPNCSVSLDLSQHFSRASSSSQSDLNCIECPECHRDICINCGVPWHIMMGCDEYQSLPVEERGAGDLSLHRLAQNNSWRRCQRCRRMIELTQGCFHMTCWCGHEFCYSCGAEYNNGVQACQCVFWDEDNAEPSAAQSCQASEIWAWDTFDCMPTAADGYSEQERAQLALIQRFLAGGFSLSGDHHHLSQQSSPPRCAADSYIVDTMKDLHQLPWLERFVSVMSDTYNDDYIQ